MVKHFVYIIENGDGIHYKGMSTNIENRLLQHNAGESKYTSVRGPWKLVYCAQFDSLSEAVKEEKRIKRLNKLSLLKLIAGYANPHT
jgi:putative endonuclease